MVGLPTIETQHPKQVNTWNRI